MQPGTLYGIGVGPGAPDLLTLRAVSTLARVDVVFAAASSRNDYSVALDIARPHLRHDVAIERLDFPMTRDQSVLTAAWKANADAVEAVLRTGRNAAFLTLGDPLIYSTFGYLLRTLTALAPDLPVEVIPGVTSYQAAAAKTRTILCESGENLLLLAGIQDAARLDTALTRADNAVILKAYRNFSSIRTMLASHEATRDTVFVSRLGMEGEVVARDLHAAPEHPHYLSLLLVTDRQHGNPEHTAESTSDAEADETAD